MTANGPLKTGWARVFGLVRSPRESAALRAVIERLSHQLPEAHDLVVDDETAAEYLGAQGTSPDTIAEGLTPDDIGFAAMNDPTSPSDYDDTDVAEEEIDHFLERCTRANVVFSARARGGR